jgi:Protein of unknown function (DUF2855)
MSEFQIRRDNYITNRVVHEQTLSEHTSLDEGEILVRVDRFAFTANNITYAATGDTLGYWQFFPPSGDDAAGWGILPVWGFADVVKSNSPSIPVGERLFGYFAPISFLKMTPTRVTPQRFIDGSAHRAALPPGYNNYTRVHAEPQYDRAMDDTRMLLWPLHMTSFCLWDMLKDHQWFDATQIIILSASSKTSVGLAYALSADASSPTAIAVTSARNHDFVKRLDLYRQVVSYEDVTAINATQPTVIVDMSGNGEILGRLHKHLGDNMKRCINVGMTHWQQTQNRDDMIAERSEFFFAPGHIQKRMKDWGAETFAAKTSAFLSDTAAKTRSLITFRELDGLHGLAEIYADVCDGRVAPEQGLIVNM